MYMYMWPTASYLHLEMFHCYSAWICDFDLRNSMQGLMDPLVTVNGYQVEIAFSPSLCLAASVFDGPLTS